MDVPRQRRRPGAARRRRVTETFTATVTDDRGATATQAVVVTIRGTNDAPVSSDGDVETAKGNRDLGHAVAADGDAGDVLTFGPGPTAPARRNRRDRRGRQLHLHAQSPGFQGLDGFDFTVSDGQGATSTSRVTVAVLSPVSAGRRAARRCRSASRGGREPAGNGDLDRLAGRCHGVNLVMALDRSGSIGAAEWSVQVNQVADALEALAARFAGAATSVDVQHRGLCHVRDRRRTFDLTDPALITTVRSLPYTGGGTNYTSALTLTENFFDSQPAGRRTSSTSSRMANRPTAPGPRSSNRLTDETAKGYDLQIEAFGIGGQIDFDTLSASTRRPKLLAGAGELTDAFTATPLFSADLVSLTVDLIADGVSAA
jgi:hypothetical protein